MHASLMTCSVTFYRSLQKFQNFTDILQEFATHATFKSSVGSSLTLSPVGICVVVDWLCDSEEE